MGVRLICKKCGHISASALFYRGPDEHNCKVCGGELDLVDPSQDRRQGGDRRTDEAGVNRDTDWRDGDDRRRSPAS